MVSRTTMAIGTLGIGTGNFASFTCQANTKVNTIADTLAVIPRISTELLKSWFNL